MDNLILILIIAAVVVAAAGYVYREKKKGKKCIGCPMAQSCKNSENCPSTKVTDVD